MSEGRVEGRVDGHGLHQGKIEERVAAVAAALVAGDALGILGSHMGKDGVRLVTQDGIAGEDGAQVWDHGIFLGESPRGFLRHGAGGAPGPE